MIVKPISRISLLSRMIALMFLTTLSGCIQMHTTVHVRKDGSGTIQERVLLTGMFSGMMKDTPEGGSADKEEMPPPKENELKAMAAQFGADVRVVDVKKVKSREGSGYEVSFAFDDINTVRIGNAQQASMKLSADSTSVKAGGPEAPADSSSTRKPQTWFTFAMNRGAHPELVISKKTDLHAASGKVPGAKSSGTAREQDQGEMLKMMAPFLKGMKMSVDVVIDGRIVKSDASYRTGNRIVLYSLDFDRLLKHPELLTGRYEGMSDKEFSRKAGKNSGLKYECNDQVRVVFN